MRIEQYGIYEFDLAEEKGLDEPQIEYLAVISPIEMNDVLQTVIVAPLCNSCALTPTTFLIDDITRIRLDQIYSLKKEYVVRYIDKIKTQKVNSIKKVLEEMLVK